MFEYQISARRVDAHGSLAFAKSAEITLDTDVKGRADAFNPAELLLAALSACMIKGVERAIPLLKFQLRGVEIRVRGLRQDAPPQMIEIEYEVVIDTDESDHRLELLHKNIRKYGTVSNTLALALKLKGKILRKTNSTA